MADQKKSGSLKCTLAKKGFWLVFLAIGAALASVAGAYQFDCGCIQGHLKSLPEVELQLFRHFAGDDNLAARGVAGGAGSLMALVGLAMFFRRSKPKS